MGSVGPLVRPPGVAQAAIIAKAATVRTRGTVRIDRSECDIDMEVVWRRSIAYKGNQQAERPEEHRRGDPKSRLVGVRTGLSGHRSSAGSAGLPSTSGSVYL